jgi:hypothetical protein
MGEEIEGNSSKVDIEDNTSLAKYKLVYLGGVTNVFLRN